MNIHSPSRPRRSAGFTLVELVIVITIIAVLSGSGIYLIIGFIDDDRGKFRTSVQGVPVLGSLEQVAPLLASGQVAQVVVSTSTVAPERLEMLAGLCADADVRTLVASLQFHESPRFGAPPRS